MANVKVHIPGLIEPGGVFDPGPGAPAGTWDDDSDATYSEGDSAAQLSKAPNVTRNVGRARVFAHVRYSGTSDPFCSVVGDADGFDTTLQPITDATPGGPSDVPVWSTQELGGDMTNFIESLYDPGVTSKFLLIGINGLVYEAYIIVQGPGEAASCRNFPASTSTSVGGTVRGFPPSKFWGNSNRFAGGHG